MRRHQMETFSASLAICAGNSPTSGEFPAQRPVMPSFDVFFDLCLNKRLRKQSEAGDLRRYHIHYDVIVMIGTHFKPKTSSNYHSNYPEEATGCQSDCFQWQSVLYCKYDILIAIPVGKFPNYSAPTGSISVYIYSWHIFVVRLTYIYIYICSKVII